MSVNFGAIAAAFETVRPGGVLNGFEKESTRQRHLAEQDLGDYDYDEDYIEGDPNFAIPEPRVHHEWLTDRSG